METFTTKVGRARRFPRFGAILGMGVNGKRSWHWWPSNGPAAIFFAFVIATLMMILFVSGYLPSLDRGFWELYFSVWCLPCGFVVATMVMLLWRSQTKVFLEPQHQPSFTIFSFCQSRFITFQQEKHGGFNVQRHFFKSDFNQEKGVWRGKNGPQNSEVFCSPSPTSEDRICINQQDQDLKAQAIFSLAGLLKNSDVMLILWDPTWTETWKIFFNKKDVKSRSGFKKTTTHVERWAKKVFFLGGGTCTAWLNLVDSFVCLFFSMWVLSISFTFKSGPNGICVENKPATKPQPPRRDYGVYLNWQRSWKARQHHQENKPW